MLTLLHRFLIDVPVYLVFVFTTLVVANDGLCRRGTVFCGFAGARIRILLFHVGLED